MSSQLLSALHLTRHAPSISPQLLVSMLEALDTLEKEWMAYAQCLEGSDTTTVASPQLSALVEQVNAKCHRVHHLLATTITHGRKRTREDDEEEMVSNEVEKRLRMSNQQRLEGEIRFGLDDRVPDQVPIDDRMSGGEQAGDGGMRGPAVITPGREGSSGLPMDDDGWLMDYESPRVPSAGEGSDMQKNNGLDGPERRGETEPEGESGGVSNGTEAHEARQEGGDMTHLHDEASTGDAGPEEEGVEVQNGGSKVMLF